MPTQIPPRQLQEWLKQGKQVFLLDVRQPWEHEFAALPASCLIPLQELPSSLEEIRPEQGAVVVVYCHHGIRSLSGAAILEQNGIAPAYSLAGGIDAWSLEIDSSVPRYR